MGKANNSQQLAEQFAAAFGLTEGSAEQGAGGAEQEIRPDTLLTFSDTARVLGLHLSTIHYLHRAGEFGLAARKFGTTWVVPAWAVERYRQRAWRANLAHMGRRRRVPETPICQLPANFAWPDHPGHAEQKEQEEPAEAAAN